MEDDAKPNYLLTRRTKKNRQTKTQLVFDEQARKEYLTGFHKRKMERRERAQKELEDEIKADLKVLRQKRREEMRKKHEALGLLDTVEHVAKKSTIQLKNHTIEVTEIDDKFISETGLFMGPNQGQSDPTHHAEEEEDNDEQVEAQKSKSKRPLSKKMSILQNMKAPNAIKKGHRSKGKVRKSKVKYGKNGGIQTASKKKRTRK